MQVGGANQRQTTDPLLVRGGSSDVVNEAGVQEFLELCPHADYLNVLDAGHVANGDRNDRFGDARLDFVARAARR